MADYVIELSGKLDVVTSSHLGESADDVLHFAVNATYPFEEVLNLILYYKLGSEKSDDLIRAIRKDARAVEVQLQG